MRMYSLYILVKNKLILNYIQGEHSDDFLCLCLFGSKKTWEFCLW